MTARVRTPGQLSAARSPGWRRAASALAPLVVVVTVLAAWELGVLVWDVDPIILPAPTAVAGALVDDWGLLREGLWLTARAVVLGLALALVLGVAAGLLLHRSPALRRAFEPLLVGSQAVPVPVLAPLLVVWLGFGLLPQLALVVVIAFFPVTVSTRDALGSLPGETDLVLRNLGASWWQRLRLAELPNALPGMLTGVRLAAVFAVIGAVFGDAAGSSGTTAADDTASGGLGRIVTDAVSQLRMDLAFAAIALLVLLSLIAFWSLTLAERRLTDRTSTALTETP